jgi:hypothetical protein
MNMMKLAAIPAAIIYLAALNSGFTYADAGSSNATLTLVVPVQTTVSCSSASVTASPGTNTLTVSCTLNGNPNNLAAGTANSFTQSVPLSDGNGHTLTATAQSTVTGTTGLGSISGTSAGFSGSITAIPATVQATYTVPTTTTTKSGTYTGVTTYTWSTI